MVEGTYIFDCEVFAHDWLFVFKEVATGEYTVIWNDNDEVLAFMERNRIWAASTTSTTITTYSRQLCVGSPRNR